jgi:5-deoxy-5-amino-3-dehydroquinate synthase
VRIPVDLAERSYDVIVEEGARTRLAKLVAERAPRARLAAIVAPAALRSFDWFDLDPGVESVVVEVPDGESAKTLGVLEGLCEQLSGHRFSREDVLVGVGGGATTDLAGFAAAVYLRGVAVCHVPTTLLAQVDAAIGGKTAVDLAVGKNLVGAFHQPLGVLCDLEVLATLPERERRSGLGEVAKCWLLEGRTPEDARAASVAELTTVAVSLKAAIVAEDEREGGRRALLNYGHTLAHALEALQLAGASLDLTHGEAVAIGVAFAARLAARLGRVGRDEVALHDEVLDALGLASSMPPGVDLDGALAAMGRDKKARHDLAFVLDGPNGFELVPDVSTSEVRDALEDFQREGR